MNRRRATELLPRADVATRRRAAERARLLLNDLGADAKEFAQRWIGFNALYCEYEGARERDQFMRAIETGVSDSQALGILDAHVAEVCFLAELPPGNMRRFGRPGFRQRARKDISMALDGSLSPRARLSHLIGAVYQVRCNLFHGQKNPHLARSRKLLAISTRLTEAVVHALIESVEADTAS